ncbi:hypothetical protein WN51_11108 [Melipona quadrifasciata]|uniref:Uncharacterized protein n=1 Tax=Melipona quadrifasciata TaxID=166423 RepID=A0A0N0U627_9HYME|nr:hypothetical protein WN51_11108 [Melipona quadrifasciata]
MEAHARNVESVLVYYCRRVARKILKRAETENTFAVDPLRDTINSFVWSNEISRFFCFSILSAAGIATKLVCEAETETEKDNKWKFRFLRDCRFKAPRLGKMLTNYPQEFCRPFTMSSNSDFQHFQALNFKIRTKARAGPALNRKNRKRAPYQSILLHQVNENKIELYKAVMVFNEEPGGSAKTSAVYQLNINRPTGNQLKQEERDTSEEKRQARKVTQFLRGQESLLTSEWNENNIDRRSVKVQSTPFIMTMPVSLTKDDPSCGYKLPQDPHIGFLPSPLQNLTVPSYLALNVGKWRWIASFAGDASPLTMTHFHDMDCCYDMYIPIECLNLE